MSKILYSAVDRRGRSTNGYIDAATNEAALKQLTDAGYSSIQFHDDASASFPRDWLSHANDKDLEASASFEIRARQTSGFGDFMLGVFQANRWSTLAGLGLAVWGSMQASILWITIGAVCGLTMPLVSAWNYRAVKRFDDMLIAFAEGDWKKTRKLIASLRAHDPGDAWQFELEIRDAIANAENTPLETTIAGLKGWIEKLEGISPGLYALRVASVYAHYGRHDCVLELMREAYRKSPRSPVMTLDLALAEIRFGEAGRAEQLVESMGTETMPTNAAPFLDWVLALIRQGRGEADAGGYFRRAIAGMIDLGAGATYLQSLAMCVADYAVYCLDSGSMSEQVDEMLVTVWPVIRAHGEESMVEKLSRARPALSRE